MRRWSLFSLVFLLTLKAFTQERFVNPIDGVLGQDFIIVNYVDWGASSAVLDNHCLSKSYDGHQGTDYVLKSFRAMDEGVNVRAVDTGIVIFTLDGEYDREKESDPSKGLGNYVGITHSGYYQTYYGHLKKNSILVDPGDTVYPGQIIVQVASSGNSSDPHLHFELWYDNTFYIDPYAGPCGNAGTYWLDAYPFDSSFSVWQAHTWNGNPSLDTLRESPLHVDSFSTADSLVTYWSLLYGLRAEDSLSTHWYTPHDSLWLVSEYQVLQDWWYYYEWSYLSVDSTLPSGEWTCVLHRNNIPVDTQRFLFMNPRDTLEMDTNGGDSSSGVTSITKSFRVWQQDNSLMSNLSFPTTAMIHHIDGRMVSVLAWKQGYPLDLSRLKQGYYVVSVYREDQLLLTKKIMR
jgi:murein DD-endopeptidase MepM/ murein hydrolase activator NlpD